MKYVRMWCAYQGVENVSFGEKFTYVLIGCPFKYLLQISSFGVDQPLDVRPFNN